MYLEVTAQQPFSAFSDVNSISKFTPCGNLTSLASRIEGVERHISSSRVTHSELSTPMHASTSQDSRESIASIMSRTGTDKLTRHAYDRYYERHFKEFRDKADVKILEIGADTGLSIQLWAEYFSSPGAIHGISYGVPTNQKKAVCDFSPLACDKVEIFSGDQSNPAFLKTITDRYTYDIIVDDGSHVPQHQIISFKYLFPVLKPGGLYILEDLETSYWNVPGTSLYGYPISAGGIGTSAAVSAIEKLKQFIDVMMRFHMAHSSLQIMQEDDKFFSITFGQGLAIIRKASTAEMQHLPAIPEAPVIHSGIDEWATAAKESTQSITTV